jgi:tRNA nucleotidyltransferase/poly(A) polymerase
MSRIGAIELARGLRARGFQAWLVGGSVRDLVLGREPKDYDIATDARPEELLGLFPRAQLVGAQFGVVLVDGVEIATFRSDHAYSDGRHPEHVTFDADPKQDVLRRDFTINGLLLDPSALSSSYSSSSLYSFPSPFFRPQSLSTDRLA